MAKFFGDEGKVNVLCCELDSVIFTSILPEPTSMFNIGAALLENFAAYGSYHTAEKQFTVERSTSPSDNQGFWDGKAQKSNEGWKMVNTALYPFMKHKNSWLLQEPKSLVFVCPQALCPSPVLHDHDKVHCLMSPLSSREHRDCFCAEILV